AQCEVSAIYEAIEHLFSIFRLTAGDKSPKVLDLGGDDAPLVGGCPDFTCIRGRSATFSRVVFEPLDGDGPHLLFPTFLTDPGFLASSAEELQTLRDYSLMRYSTNSGTAAGSSADEGILHGLLELIERDGLGIELLRCVVRQTPYPV